MISSGDTDPPRGPGGIRPRTWPPRTTRPPSSLGDRGSSHSPATPTLEQPPPDGRGAPARGHQGRRAARLVNRAHAVQQPAKDLKILHPAPAPPHRPSRRSAATARIKIQPAPQASVPPRAGPGHGSAGDPGALYVHRRQAASTTWEAADTGPLPGGRLAAYRRVPLDNMTQPGRAERRAQPLHRGLLVQAGVSVGGYRILGEAAPRHHALMARSQSVPGPIRSGSGSRRPGIRVAARPSILS